MKTNIFNNTRLITTLEGFTLFSLLSFIFFEVGFYNFSYLEQWNTFIYDKEIYNGIFFQPGGVVNLISTFLIQFFAYPLLGILITAFILTSIALLTTNILYSWSKNRVSFPLSLFLIAPLIFLHYNVNYNYSGTLALLLMLILIQVYLSLKKAIFIYPFSILSTLLLYLFAGPIASLYVVLLIIIELSRFKSKSPFILLAPIVLFFSICYALTQGFAGEWNQLLLPNGYFTLRLNPGSIVYMPWIIIITLFVVCAITKLFTLSKRWMIYVTYLAIFLGASVFIMFGINRYIDRNNENFKELNFYAKNSQWDKIIAKCCSIPINNLLFQNYLNVALAEKGELAENLFKEPCVDIQTIYVVSNKTPYISALLSDVYFSMGHIAFSQRAAFEANEGVGNFSPRMLQRLVQTNIIYGAYGVADKYLKLLENTLFYKDWVKQYRKFLWNDAAVEADPLLGSKRLCLFPDNRFSGIYGLDDDLKQIIMSNPSHKLTIEYLGSLYLLFKDLPRFMQIINLLYENKQLKLPLPLYFQEAVVAYADGDKEILKRYDIDDSIVNRYDSFKQEPLKQPNSFWHFLKFRI